MQRASAKVVVVNGLFGACLNLPLLAAPKITKNVPRSNRGDELLIFVFVMCCKTQICQRSILLSTAFMCSSLSPFGLGAGKGSNSK